MQSTDKKKKEKEKKEKEEKGQRERKYASPDRGRVDEDEKSAPR